MQQCSYTRGSLSLVRCLTSFARTRMMMFDSGATVSGPTGDVLPKVDNGDYASGGWKSEDGRLSCGYSSFRGRRASMEDFYDTKSSKIDGQSVCLFGIFDGHGGSRAAEFLKKHLFENIMKHSEFITNSKVAISQIIEYVRGSFCNFSNLMGSFCDLAKPEGETYMQTDIDFLESERDTFRDDGSTASAAILVGNRLYVANVGDSRTIISKAGKVIALSDDHKPNRSDERKRIESAGGVVMWAGTWRVGGVLAMSRAFGNRMLKQYVVAEPEIQEQEIDQDLDLLVLASDGLWDVVPNEDAVSIAQTEEEPEAAARKLTETAFSRGSADNITCIVVKFHHDGEETNQDLESKAEPMKIEQNNEPTANPDLESKAEPMKIEQNNEPAANPGETQQN